MYSIMKTSNENWFELVQKKLFCFFAFTDTERIYPYYIQYLWFFILAHQLTSLNALSL